MPAAYRIDPERRVVLWDLSGPLTDDELLTNWRELRDDPEYDPAHRILIDARAITSLGVTSAAVSEMARLSPDVGGAKRAIVVSSNAVFGLARAYQILRDDAPEEVQVFRDVGEARDWLGPAAQPG